MINVDKPLAKMHDVKQAAKEIEVALQKSFNPTLNTYNMDTFKKKLAENGKSL
jgi:hypothetical protein